MLAVYGFGNLRITHQNIVIDQFPTRQVEELLGFLLLKPKIRHPREKLITMLWPEIPSVSEGRHRFSIVLSRLRKLFKQLKPSFEYHIQATRHWVSWVPSQSLVFDKERFVVACNQGFQEKAILVKEQYLHTAISIYRADFFEGIYTDWCLAEREYLARLRLRALGQLMHSCMQRQAFAEAIDYGKTILMDEPLREETHRALMLCYQQQYRPDRAAKQYFDFQELLANELNIHPLPETTKLFAEIMIQRSQKTLKDHKPSTEKENLVKAYSQFLATARHLEKLL